MTQLAFSPNDTYLLSVSRDRAFCLFKSGESGYERVQLESEAHGRIIWACAWSHDGRYFATASRDKTVKFWSVENDKASCVATLKCSGPATAVAFYPQHVGEGYIVAVGLEDGDIQLHKASATMQEIELWHGVARELGHVDAVKRLRWGKDKTANKLLSCSVDCSIRLFSVEFV